MRALHVSIAQSEHGNARHGVCFDQVGLQTVFFQSVSDSNFIIRQPVIICLCVTMNYCHPQTSRYLIAIKDSTK